MDFQSLNKPCTLSAGWLITLDIINFDYKINTSITIGTGIKQEKVNIDKLNITISFGI